MPNIPPITGGQKKPIALNINMDSMRECLKLVGGDPASLTTDHSFFAVMDRFISIASEHGAKLTIFVIGRDLEDARNFDQVREWSRQGHEIGNHTYSHHQFFGQLDVAGIRDEIRKSHHLIESCIGHPPRGFVAPAWSYSPLQLPELQELGYLYDTSLFPSYLMPMIQLALKVKSKLSDKSIPLIRTDWPGSLAGSRHPYLATNQDPWGLKKSSQEPGLLMMPLPTALMRVPVWHTLAFSFSEPVFSFLLQSAIRRSDFFYYLMHPADLTCPESDLEGSADLMGIERMGWSLKKKDMKLRRSLELISRHGYFVTMQELARLAHAAR